MYAQPDSLLLAEIQSLTDTYGSKYLKQKVFSKVFHFFSSGEIDYISGGMLRSSARVAEINIGDPDKFYIPLYVLAGATSQPSQEGYGINALSATELLNNYGGIFGVGIHGNRKLKNLSENTKISAIYQLAVRSINGVSVELDKNISLLSKLVVSGISIDTKAWKSDQLPSDGRAWLKAFFSFSINDKEKIHQVFGCHSASNLAGGNIQCGVDIKDFLAVKFGYHSYLNNRHIPGFGESIYVFSADFSISSD
jgi:hypothetical protein